VKRHFRFLHGTLLLVPFLSACAARTAVRDFPPASPGEARDALAAWTTAAARAGSLPPSRLLYDARMSSGAAALPGTLAVVDDGREVLRASLTGPFGSRIAEYSAGAVTGEDRRALVVDPRALRAVLAGTWPAAPSGVDGCDGGECRLVWNGQPSVEAILDVSRARVRSMVIEGPSGRLSIEYDGEPNPWPERIVLREERSSRRLSLHLAAIEPLGALPAPGP
jgi:hypothetical protein